MPLVLAPEIPQWGVGANRYRTDCGPASVAMLLSLYGRLNGLTIDALANETGLRFNDSGLMPDALVKLAAAHGLTLRNHIGTSLDAIRAEIDAGRPVIALIAYRFIGNRLDQADNNPANDGHYFVVTGYDDTHFVVNDPDVWTPYLERGHEMWIAITDLDRALAGDNFNSQCLFVEDLTLTDQIIAHANAIIALAQQQAATAPPAPPPSEPIVAVVVNRDSTNVRNGPTTAAPVMTVLPAGTALNVQDVKVSANGHNWYRIADGAYQGDYIAQEVTSPKA